MPQTLEQAKVLTLQTGVGSNQRIHTLDEFEICNRTLYAVTSNGDRIEMPVANANIKYQYPR